MTESAKNEDGSKRTAPPYVSYKTFRNYLESLRSGVPGRIDYTVLGSYSGSARRHLVQSLRFLHLIGTDGVPDARLEKLAQASGADRQRLLADLLRASYPYLFKLDLSRATTKQLADAFATAGAGGDTVRKCVKFFVAAAKDAALPISPFIKSASAASNGARRRKQSQDPATPATPAAMPMASPPQQRQLTLYEMLIGILSPEMNDEQKQAVWTLIQYLKEKETS